MEEEEKFYGEGEESFLKLGFTIIWGAFFSFFGPKWKELMRKQYDGWKGEKRKHKLKPRGS